MGYTKTNWVNGTTKVNQTTMNNIENGIVANEVAINEKASIFINSVLPAVAERKANTMYFKVTQ